MMNRTYDQCSTQGGRVHFEFDQPLRVTDIVMQYKNTGLYQLSGVAADGHPVVFYSGNQVQDVYSERWKSLTFEYFVLPGRQPSQACVTIHGEED